MTNSPAPGADERPETSIPLLEGTDLECVRGQNLLFSGLNFSIAPGEIQQVEGANGAGKTSLLRIICGLSLPERGDVTWRGESIFKQRSDYLSELAYVGHLHGFKDELTPVENLNVSTALCGARSGLSAEESLAHVGLFGYENIPCRYLSAGQRRRVAMARLIVSGARLWVLDEPVTAIDRKGVEDFERLIESHAAGGGMVLLTSHQLLRFGTLPIHSIELRS